MTHTPLAGERLQPLGHVSVGGTSDFTAALQPLMHPITAPPDLQHSLTVILSNLARPVTRPKPGHDDCIPKITCMFTGYFLRGCTPLKKLGGLNANTKHKGRGTCRALALQ